MLSDKNLRGKSSILEVVHWLLRGRPTSNLQDDVRRWIHKASVRFLSEDVEHVRDDKRAIKHAKGERWHSEEIHRGDGFAVVM
jgi:hypothetical protein